MPVPFGKWRPDVFELDTGVAGDVNGVLPGSNSKLPWPALEAYSEALPGPIRGGCFTRAQDGSIAIYAGTATRLYRFVGVGRPWADVSQHDYALPEGDRWSFAQFGSKLIAVNVADNPQDLNIDTGAAAVDLAGSPPKARRVATIGDHVWLLSISDNPSMAVWSGTNDAEWWTLGERDCDEQLFPDGGDITGITTMETGLIFQQGVVRRFSPTIDRRIYTFNQIDDSKGLVSPDSLVTTAGAAYYLSTKGFVATDSSGATLPIGFEQVDGWFKKRVDNTNLYSIIGCADPLQSRIFWLFSSNAASASLMDTCLCYDIKLQEWTYAEFEAYQMLSGASIGMSLEEIDSLGFNLDSLPFSLDSRKFAGGAPLLAGFDGEGRIGFFTGANMAARVETGEFQPVPMRRSFIRGVQPLTDAQTAEVSIGSRENQQYSRQWSAPSQINLQGWAPTRVSGRYHRIRLDIPAGASWSHLAGVEVDTVQDGQR